MSETRAGSAGARQNYLKVTGKKLGLVINFGEEKVKVRRVANGV